MTVQEAIGALNLCKDTRIFMPSVETIDIAIESMEKQIPKKLELKNGLYHCSSCGMPVLSHTSYCSECGNKIDWEEGAE